MSGAIESVGKWLAAKNPQAALTRRIDPGGGNDLVKFIDPGATISNRINKGEGATLKVGLDPGAYFTQTETQQKAQQDKIKAAQDLATPPTLDSAFNYANQQADLLRRRRGVLGNVFAGKSTLG